MMGDDEDARKQYLDYDKKFEDMMDQIKDDTEWYCETYRDVFLLGACYAVNKNLPPKPLNKNTRNQKNKIRISEVIRESHRAILKVIAFSSQKNIEILLKEGKYFDIAEMYANAGLEEIQNKYFNKTDSPSFEFAEIVI